MYSPYDDLLGESDLYFGDTGNYSSSSSSSLSRVREVREAGERLHLLSRQVSDLEDIIRKQGAALSEKDAGHKVLRSQLKELKEMKERQIRELASVVKRLEEKNHQLDLQVKEKDDSLNECRKKLVTLDRVVAHSIPSFEKLINSLKKFTLMSDSMATTGRHDGLTDSHLFATGLTIDQVTLDTCDSGNPSSASDSYPVTGDDYDSIKRRLSSDVASVIRSSISRSAVGGRESIADRSSVLSRVQRSLGYSGKQFERASESLASLPTDLVSAVSSPKHSTRLSSVDVSPAYTPTAVRRRLHQPSKLLLSNSSVTSNYTSDVPSYGYEDGKMNENNELQMLLMMAREEGRTATGKAIDDEPPEPAPPPTTNPGNDNLPCIQAPRRFLPSLNSRYE